MRKTLLSASRLAGLGLVLAITAKPAEAQICAGGAPFSSGPVRIGAGEGRIGGGFGGADGKPSLGLRLSLGATKGPFASLGASTSFYSSSSPNPFIREGFARDTLDDAAGGHVTLSGGFGISVSAARNIMVCPIAGVSNQTGPTLAEYREVSGGNRPCSGIGSGSGRAYWFGGNVGSLTKLSSTLALAPFAGGAYVNSRIAAGGRSARDDYFEITVGVGFLYRRLTIRPTASFPIGLEEGRWNPGLEFALNLGPKR